MRENIMHGFEFTAMHYPFYKRDAIKIETGIKTVQEYQSFICENGIEKAEIVMPNLEVLKKCPSLKYLKISPSFDAPENFDFSPLYDGREILSLNCQNQYGERGQYISPIYYERISGLVELFVGVNRRTFGFNKIESLKSLRVGGFKGEKRDISDLFCSKELDTLQLLDCGIQSLAGIEKASKMQCVYLNYNRSLNDIGGLTSIKETLKALRIENCPHIKDFSVLGELENLELLELSGSNRLPNLRFLKNMKNLKTFIFNMSVEDGNLSPCLDLQYVYSEKNRKHYNLKDKDLPKGRYVRGNETIEEWRRLE